MSDGHLMFGPPWEQRLKQPAAYLRVEAAHAVHSTATPKRKKSPCGQKSQSTFKGLEFRSSRFPRSAFSERREQVQSRLNPVEGGSGMIWARMLAYITGTVDQELLLRNEYLAAENRILRAQIQGRLMLSDAEKATLAEIAYRLKRKALEELAAVAKPDTLLVWYRRLIVHKFDGSKFRKSLGRPRVDEETERLVVHMAKENPGWGYDRIVGAMANLGHRLSDQTVGHILH